MKVTYVLNTYFFEHLSDYGVLQKDIATCIGIGSSAVSKRFNSGNITMFMIDAIAELGKFSHGSFMQLSNGSPHHATQVPDYQKPKYRLYYLLSDLASIYGSIENISKATHVDYNKLRSLKEKTQDAKDGWVTTTAVLKDFRYTDYLKLLSCLDNPNPWRYVNDENGAYPIAEEISQMYVPSQSYNLLRADNQATIEKMSRAAEELNSKYDEACKQKAESEKKNSELKALLASERKDNEVKRSIISSQRAEQIATRNGYLSTIDFVKGKMHELDQMDIPDDAHRIILDVMKLLNTKEKQLK